MIAPGEKIRAGRLRRLGVVVAAVIVAVLVWLLLKGGGEHRATAGATPQIVGVGELRSLSGQLGHPIYWAGPEPGARLELTHDADGRVYVRYLTGGAPAGDPRPLFLTVGTYPVPDAQAALRRAARQSSAPLRRVPGGGLALVRPGDPTSVYFAYPGSSSQVEVFDPSPKRALDLVLSGGVVPVG